MKDRIHQLMEAQHMNQQAFARFTNIGTASLSSIFTGRTRPTMNHVIAIMNAFPNVNPTWLIKGEGGMMLAEPSPTSQNSSGTDQNNGVQGEDKGDGQLSLFGDNRTTKGVELRTDNVSVHPSVLPPVNPKSQSKYKVSSSDDSQTTPHVTLQRRITEIRVFFDDQTWESFVPKNK